jgi:oxygen-dependent protoporphyrinogen oxidase
MQVGIVGAGLSGLVAAHDLEAAGVTVTLFEAAPTVGGQIRTRRMDGFVVEEGAEGFVTADQDVPRLCENLGLASQLIPQAERRSLVLRDSRLTPLSAGEATRLLGIQASEEDLGRGIVSLRDGMGALTDALAAGLPRATVRMNAAVRSLAQTGTTWRLALSSGSAVEVDTVVLATAPSAIADLVEPLAPGASRALRSINMMSNVSVSLAYPRSAVSHPLDASGIVVATEEISAEGLRACAFSSSKFSERAPADHVLLRAFFRPEEADMHNRRMWEKRATQVLAKVLGIEGSPSRTWTAEWPRALPIYGRDHDTKMNDIAEQLRRVGSIELAGSAYHRGGVPGAVRSGQGVARRLLESR